jgi:hypothetical protein
MLSSFAAVTALCLAVPAPDTPIEPREVCPLPSYHVCIKNVQELNQWISIAYHHAGWQDAGLHDAYIRALKRMAQFWSDMATLIAYMEEDETPFWENWWSRREMQREAYERIIEYIGQVAFDNGWWPPVPRYVAPQD